MKMKIAGARARAHRPLPLVGQDHPPLADPSPTIVGPSWWRWGGGSEGSALAFYLLLLILFFFFFKYIYLMYLIFIFKMTSF